MAKVDGQAIVCCKCSSIPDFCKKAFKVLRPDSPVPAIYMGTEITRLIAELSPQTEIEQKLLGLSSKRGRYGYYFEWDEKGEVLFAWNLLQSRRIQ